jgi:hypothetical protein
MIPDSSGAKAKFMQRVYFITETLPPIKMPDQVEKLARQLDG